MPNAGNPAPLADLFAAARRAQANAYAPSSKFPVGAALRSSSGAIFAGCNVENAAYPSGICAETAAIAAMVVAGERQIDESVVIGPGTVPLTPCGACRQRLHEFATPLTRIHAAADSGATQAMSLAALLPHAFGPHRLAPMPAAKDTP